MRLKPGEVRKPRPASQGNLESRMQDMRNKEGQKRGYRPDTDTTKPFQWATDVDQNNVNQTQAERDRREENSGHQIVQYTNKDQQENNPKVAFNLKHHKKSAHATVWDEIVQKLRAAGVSHNQQMKIAEAAVDDVDKAIEMANQAIADAKVILDEKINGNGEAPNPETEEKTAKVEKDSIQTIERKQFPEATTGCVTCKGFNMKDYKTAKDEGVTYEGEHFDVNPWAACNKSTGGKSKGEAKFERCVQHVKDQSGDKKDDKKDDDKKDEKEDKKEDKKKS